MQRVRIKGITYVTHSHICTYLLHSIYQLLARNIIPSILSLWMNYFLPVTDSIFAATDKQGFFFRQYIHNKEQYRLFLIRSTNYFFKNLTANCHQFTHFVKITQINFVTRSRLHNTANSCQHLNFGLSWPGQGQSVKAKHCQPLKFSLLFSILHCHSLVLLLSIQRKT